MATSFAAVKCGIVIFVIPFVFAFHPELLLIDAAMLDPTASGSDRWLPGYDGQIHLGALLWLLARLVFALYLLASALNRFDHRALPVWDVVARLVLAVMLLSGSPLIYGIGLVLAALLVGAHIINARQTSAPVAQ